MPGALGELPVLALAPVQTAYEGNVHALSPYY
jgi:hypothetical protein